MPVTQESRENYRIAETNDVLTGIMDIRNNNIHLAQGTRDDNLQHTRWSTINGVVRREFLARRGGHAQLAQWAGIPARQIRPGVAAGQAVGFTLIKADAGFSFTWISGLNTQYNADGSREMPSNYKMLVMMATSQDLK